MVEAASVISIGAMKDPPPALPLLPIKFPFPNAQVLQPPLNLKGKLFRQPAPFTSPASRLR